MNHYSPNTPRPPDVLKYVLNRTQRKTDLGGLGWELVKARGDRHSTEIFVVQGRKECRGLATEILLVVNQTLWKEGNIALHEIIDHRPFPAILFDKGEPEDSFNGVEHLQCRTTSEWNSAR